MIFVVGVSTWSLFSALTPSLEGGPVTNPNKWGKKTEWLTEIQLESDQCWCGKDVDCFFLALCTY